jgi:hypothetical protein
MVEVADAERSPLVRTFAKVGSHHTRPTFARTQSEVPLRVGDRQLLSRLAVAVLGDGLPREGIAVLAPECAEEIERSPPPCALAVRSTLVGLRRRNVQDARKLALVFVLHRAWIRPPTHAQANRRTRNASLLCSAHPPNSRNCLLCLRNLRLSWAGRPPRRASPRNEHAQRLEPRAA